MKKNNTLIIAEAGVNHNGSLDLAFKLVDEAKKAGADIIKFQTAKAGSLVSKFAPMAKYQRQNLNKNMTQKEMLEKLLLGFDEFDKLYDYCEKKGIEFLSTPFDIESIKFLNNKVNLWKIPSGEVTNLPYLIEIGKTGKPVIMSTGMCNMAEIEEAVSVLRHNGITDIILLHCTTQYPTPFEDVNLRAMETLRRHFNVEVGYSDHTIGTEIPIAAVAMGAAIIEKHFTLDRNMEGPDHKASLEPDELAQMINSIRRIETAMGSGEKVPAKSECDNITIARKSIVAKQIIKTGEIFSEQNITVKRPGNGLSPTKWFEVLGTCAKRDYEEDEFIEL